MLWFPLVLFVPLFLGLLIHHVLVHLQVVQLGLQHGLQILRSLLLLLLLRLLLLSGGRGLMCLRCCGCDLLKQLDALATGFLLLRQ